MSKKKNIKLKILPVIIVIVSIVIVISVIILINILKQNYIVYENIKNTSGINSNEVKKSNVIILNNVIVGGYTNGKWTDAKNIYDNFENTNGIDIDMYSETAKYGTFKTSILKYNSKTNVVYTTTTKVPTPEKYMAISSDQSITRTPYLKIAKETTTDIQNVKKALGKYRLLNNSVKIINVYDAYVEKNIAGRIIVATSKTNTFGIYSAVIYVGYDGPQIIKYSYVKNTERSASWPVYDVEFVLDIDYDGISEVVLQETTETTSSYSIMQYTNGTFYQVLKQTIEI